MQSRGSFSETQLIRQSGWVEGKFFRGDVVPPNLQCSCDLLTFWRFPVRSYRHHPWHRLWRGTKNRPLWLCTCIKRARLGRVTPWTSAISVSGMTFRLCVLSSCTSSAPKDITNRYVIIYSPPGDLFDFLNSTVLLTPHRISLAASFASKWEFNSDIICLSISFRIYGL